MPARLWAPLARFPPLGSGRGAPGGHGWVRAEATWARHAPALCLTAQPSHEMQASHPGPGCSDSLLPPSPAPPRGSLSGAAGRAPGIPAGLCPVLLQQICLVLSAFAHASLPVSPAPTAPPHPRPVPPTAWCPGHLSPGQSCDPTIHVLSPRGPLAGAHGALPRHPHVGAISPGRVSHPAGGGGGDWCVRSAPGPLLPAPCLGQDTACAGGSAGPAGSPCRGGDMSAPPAGGTACWQKGVVGSGQLGAVRRTAAPYLPVAALATGQFPARCPPPVDGSFSRAVTASQSGTGRASSQPCRAAVHWASVSPPCWGQKGWGWS